MPLTDRPYSPNNQAALVANQTPLNQQATTGQTLAGPIPAQFNIASATETLVPSPQNASVPLSVMVPASTQLEQTVFDLYASGIATTKAAGTVTIKVYAGNSATLANNTLLGSSGAITQNTATAAWWAHLMMIFDSVSGTLVGRIDFYVNKTVVAAVTLSNFPAGFLNQGNPSANPPTIANLPTFSLSVTSSGAVAGTPTTVNVQKFSVG